MSQIVVTVTGPSASGKTELVTDLCKNHNFEKLVSITTRPPRDGEVDGVEYYFITEEEFFKQKEADSLVQEVNFNGKYYATTRGEITRVFNSGKTPVVIVEPGGVAQFENAGKELGFKVFTTFVHAPYQVLKNRFIARLGVKEASSYDSLRLEAIQKESVEWISQVDWDLILGNAGSDVADVKWLAEWVSETLDSEIFKEAMNKERSDG